MSHRQLRRVVVLGQGRMGDASAVGDSWWPRIKPFDVARLAARDPCAVATWLAGIGFPTSRRPRHQPVAVHSRRLGGRRCQARADFVGDDAFLTRWNDYIYEPAAQDATFQRVIYRERNRGDITDLALIAIRGVCGVIATIALMKRHAAADQPLS
jgi:hypothetical protein